MFKAFTDYPVEGNPDSKVVEVTVLAYDRDKYATVEYNGTQSDVKTGYIFKDPELKVYFNNRVWYTTPREVGLPTQTKLRACREYKHSAKKSIWYSVWADSIDHKNSHQCYVSTLKEAMRMFMDTDKWHSCAIERYIGTKYNHLSFVHIPMVTRTQVDFVQPTDHKGRPYLTVAHWQK